MNRASQLSGKHCHSRLSALSVLVEGWRTSWKNSAVLPNLFAAKRKQPPRIENATLQDAWVEKNNESKKSPFSERIPGRILWKEHSRGWSFLTLVLWLMGRLIGALINRLIDWLTKLSLTCHLVDWLIDQFIIDLPFGWLIDWFTFLSLICHLVDWLIDTWHIRFRMMDRLIRIILAMTSSTFQKLFTNSVVCCTSKWVSGKLLFNFQRF